MEDKTSCINNNSIIPSIKECERFIQFLNNKFNLGLSSNIIVTIEQKQASIKGYFMPIQEGFSYQKNKELLNTITLNSLYLINAPYETIAHETAHFYNSINKINDCNPKTQYHNKKFKITAEKLLLEVTQHETRGFAITSETEAFKNMLLEFEPNKEAFLIFQNHIERSKKPKSRMLKAVCSCNCVIRTAKNEKKPLKALCLYCNTPFIIENNETEGGEDDD